jgi:hypothetical protein
MEGLERPKHKVGDLPLPSSQTLAVRGGEKGNNRAGDAKARVRAATFKNKQTQPPLASHPKKDNRTLGPVDEGLQNIL